MLAKKDLFLFSGNKRAFAMATLVAAAIANADVAPTSSAGSSGIVDFYFSQPSSGTTVPKVYVDVALIQKEVEAVVNFIPRMKASYECFGLNDDICPVNAVKCGENLEVVDGYSVAVGATTTDYTSKTGSSYTYAATASSGLTWDGCEGGITAYAEGGGDNCYPHSAAGYCASKGMRLPTLGETTAGGGPTPSCPWGGWTSNKVYYNYGWVNYIWSGARYMPYSDNNGGSGCGSFVGIRCVKNTTTYSCPSGGTLSGTTCVVNTLACPAGYTATTGAETALGECKKTVNYTYYNYQCPTTKTTTDYTAKTGSSYSYAAAAASSGLTWDGCDIAGKNRQASASYCSSKGMRLPALAETAVNGGVVPSCSGYTWTSTAHPTYSGYTYTWAQGTVGMSEDSSYYAFIFTRCVANTTTYSCPSGGTLSGSTCTVNTLACPAGYTATTGADTANGECRKDSTVPVDVPFVPKDSGGNCNKVDMHTSADNSADLSLACNSSTPPTGNCEQRTYSCPEEGAECKPISSSSTDQWCSPIGCAPDSTCKIAQCETAEMATLGATDQQKCFSMVCDANKPYNEFCGKASCPSGYGVYAQGEKCFQDVCPPDATQLPDGTCQQLKCPSGSTEVNGECVLN